MFKSSGHKVRIKMHDKSYCELILSDKDIELLMKEWDNRDSRILKVEDTYNPGDKDTKITQYINKDLIREIEVY